jgi:hypothetical protein
MNNGEPTTEFTDEEQRLIKGVEGDPKDTLEAAYESFAEKVRNALGGDDLDEHFFDERPFIETVVLVRPRAHNNWVKEYWVKAY